MLTVLWEAIGKLEKRLDALENPSVKPKTEDAAAPVELPPLGSVWGVPGKPETRRFVRCLDVINGVCFSDTEWPQSWNSLDAWHSWVRESGAVRIDGDGERAAALEAEVAELREQLSQAEDGRREMIAKANELRDKCAEAMREAIRVMEEAKERGAK